MALFLWVRPNDTSVFNDNVLNPLFANKTVINGHNPICISKCEERVLSKLDVINIDTGCVYNDNEGFKRLTAYDCNT